MIERTCHCGKKYKAREADLKRGWARSCSKSCAAWLREKKLDRFDYRNGGSKPEFGDGFDELNDEAKASMEDGWDGHKNAF